MHTSNKKLREWEELVRSTGCCVTGANYGVQVHHIRGRKFKHNKTHIGHKYIIPLHFDWHLEWGSNKNAYHRNKKGFIKEHGHPLDLFQQMLHRLHEEGVDARDWISVEEYNAIMDCPI